MADYRPDSEGTPLREAISQAIAMLKKHATSFPDQFAVPIADEDQFRADIIRIQKQTAVAVLELQETLEELTQASEERTAREVAALAGELRLRPGPPAEPAGLRLRI